MKKFLAALDVKLAAFNTHVVAMAGAVLFVPAFSLLCDADNATTLVQMVFPHFPAIAVKIISAQVVAFAAYMLYQGKPHNADKAP